MAKHWYLNNNEKLVGNLEREAIERQKSQFDHYLAISPEARDVTVGEDTYRMAVQSDGKTDERKVLFADHLIDRGDVIEFDGYKWLAIELSLDSYHYWSNLVKMCNDTLPITIEEGERVIVGYDPAGRPIYEETEEITEDIPCIVQSHTETLYDTDDAINIPEGRLQISIQNSYDSYLDIGDSVEVNGNAYMIYNKDRSSVVDGQGVLVLSVRRNVE